MIAAVVTGGYGTWGSIALVVTGGYGIGAAPTGGGTPIFASGIFLSRIIGV